MAKEPFSNYAPCHSAHFHLAGLHAETKHQTMVQPLMPSYEKQKVQEQVPFWQVALPH